VDAATLSIRAVTALECPSNLEMSISASWAAATKSSMLSRSIPLSSLVITLTRVTASSTSNPASKATWTTAITSSTERSVSSAS
jgi:hypothetical protein